MVCWSYYHIISFIYQNVFLKGQKASTQNTSAPQEDSVESRCKSYACKIQDCLAKNQYDESKCKIEILTYRNCVNYYTQIFEEKKKAEEDLLKESLKNMESSDVNKKD